MKTSITTYIQGIILLIIAAIIISIANNLSTVLYSYGATPNALVLSRFVLLFFLCSLLLLYKKIPYILSPDVRIWVGLVALGIASTSLLLLSAFAYISVSIAIIVFFTFPLLIALTNILLHKVFNVYIITIVMSAFLGVLLVIYTRTTHIEGTLGLILAFAGSVCFALSYIITQHKIAHLSTTLIMFYTAVAGILLVLFSVTLSTISLPRSEGYNVLILSTILSTSAVFIMFYTIRIVGALSSAMIMNLEPIFTTLIATTFLQEQLLPLQIVGMAIVLIALMTLEYYKAKHTKQL